MRDNPGDARHAGKPRRARATEPETTGLLLDLDVPEGRHRSLDHASHVLANSDGAVPLAERDVGRVLREPHLHSLSDGFLLARVGLARELVAQLLHLLVAGPAEHRLVTGAVEETCHDRVQDVGGDPRRQERVPAARRRRGPFWAAGGERLPNPRLPNTPVTP